MPSLSIRQMATLAKLATGNLSMEDVMTFLEGFGVEAACGEVPTDRKGDVFQRVAQFSLQPGTELKHITVVGRDGFKVEMLAVLRGANESNSDQNQKVIDEQAQATLSLSRAS